MSAADNGTDDAGGIDRRRLVRWVALLAIMVPVVIELWTFGGLVRSELFGEPAPPTPTGRPGAVGVGQELLPETAAIETVRTSEVRTDGDARTYVFSVTVSNETGDPVELRLDGVELRDDTVVEGTSTTGPLPPDGTGEVTRGWELPSESMPTGVRVTARRDGVEVVSRTVPIERPPVR